jgi:glutathione S-transferase
MMNINRQKGFSSSIGSVFITVLCICGMILQDAVVHSFSPISTVSSISSLSSSSSSQLSMGFLDDIFKQTQTKATSISSSPKVEVPPGFVIPEPQPLTITSSADLSSILKSSIALVIRLATSAFVLGWQIDTFTYNDDNDSNKKYSLPLLGFINIRDSSSVLTNAPRPKEPLILYEYDSSPYCKRVREIINILDLTVLYKPCPGARQSSFSKELYELTGKQTVPYLIDPNTNESMFESNDIINYLVNTYGPTDTSSYDKKALWPITFEQFSIFTSAYAAIICGMPSSKRQNDARTDNELMKPLELWGYECSPFVKPVREKMCSLALPHLMVSCSRGSANRDLLVAKTGRFQVPYLVDPNTGIEMFESAEICDYLDAVYTVKE